MAPTRWLFWLDSFLMPRRQGARALSVGMVPFSVYRDKVVNLKLETRLSSGDIATIAAEFMILDVEKQLAVKDVEKQLAVKDVEKQKAAKDVDKPLAVKDAEAAAKKQLALKDVETQLALIDNEHSFKYRCSVALRCRNLAAVAKRAVLERLFRFIVVIIPSNSAMRAAVEATRVLLGATKRLMLDGDVEAVKMSAVSDALHDNSFRVAAWEALGFPPDMPFPSLPYEMLYGDLSSLVHMSIRNEYYLSDQDDPVSTAFFTAAAKHPRVNVRVVAYSEAEAALADEVEKNPY